MLFLYFSVNILAYIVRIRNLELILLKMSKIKSGIAAFKFLNYYRFSDASIIGIASTVL